MKSHGNLGRKLSPEHREKVIKSLRHDQEGAKNPNWKGGIYVNDVGYVYIKVRNHPDTLSNGYIPEHRYVMEKKIGRRLSKWEHVHHINGVKGDNRPENLELVNAQTHNLITMLENRVKTLEAENRILREKINH
jgi:hypothetical protein